MENYIYVYLANGECYKLYNAEHIWFNNTGNKNLVRLQANGTHWTHFYVTPKELETDETFNNILMCEEEETPASPIKCNLDEVNDRKWKYRTHLFE